MKPLRAVSWAAVSSLPQAKKVSIDEQLRTNASHLEALHAELVEELIVPGESRSIILLEDACRKISAYRRLVELIRARSFDLLIYLDRSRLGRKASLSMAIVELCHDAGIATYETESGGGPSLGDNSDEMLLGAIKSVGAQQEVAKLVARNKFGMIARIQRGDMANNLPYGYVAVYGTDGARRIMVDEDAARVVMRVHQMRADGFSAPQIAAYLNDEGVPGIKHDAWTDFAVRSLLRRPWTYAGFAEVNRNSRAGRPYVRAQGNFPALISEELAKAVDLIRESGQTGPRISGKYLLSGVVWCEVCEMPMHRYDNRPGSSSYGWRCPKRHPGGKVTEHLALDGLREAIVEVSKHLSDLSVNRAAKRAEREAADRYNRISQRIEAASEQIERADDAYTSGLMDVDRYVRLVNRAKEKIAQLRAESDDARARLAEASISAGIDVRRRGVVERGLAILDSGDTVSANAFLRMRVRVWVKDNKVSYVEFR